MLILKKIGCAGAHTTRNIEVAIEDGMKTDIETRIAESENGMDVVYLCTVNSTITREKPKNNLNARVKIIVLLKIECKNWMASF